MGKTQILTVSNHVGIVRVFMYDSAEVTYTQATLAAKEDIRRNPPLSEGRSEYVYGLVGTANVFRIIKRPEPQFVVEEVNPERR